MRVSVLGSDARFKYLSDMLKAHESVDPAAAELVITPWPAPVDLPAGAKIVTCGPEKCTRESADLLEDEEYLCGIADLTAEGALASAMGNGRIAVAGSECLVAGWGRIGKALVGKLTALGAKVTVLSRRKGVTIEVLNAGAVWQETKNAAEAVIGKEFIFSTPPFMVFERSVLENADKQSVIIDLASPPYGVDIDAAHELGLVCRRESGLPGRHCPKNAAEAIYAAIVRRGLLKGEA